MTTTTTAISRALLAAVTKDAEVALAAVGAKHGVKLVYSRGTYGPLGTLKFDVLPVATDGTVATREASLFTKYATLMGLTPAELGRTFTTRGKTFTITGATAGLKVIATRDGKDYAFRGNDVAAALGIPPKAGLTA